MLSLQKRQKGSLTWRRAKIFSLVGRELTPILQRSIFSLLSAFKFHSLFQLIPMGGKEGRWVREVWYDNLTEKHPLESDIHMSLSGRGLEGMGRMAYADGGFNSFLTKWCFQQWRLGSISWLARTGSWVYSSSLGVGMKPSIQGTPGSFQTLMEVPLPMVQHAPLIMTFACLIAFQMGEAWLGGSKYN